MGVATFFRFGVVGAINFVLTLVVFYILVRFATWNHLVALAVSWASGISFTYCLNYVWVFKPTRVFSFSKRFVKYICTSLFSLVLNMIALEFLVSLYSLDPFLAQMLLVPFILTFNFFLIQAWSMRIEG